MNYHNITKCDQNNGDGLRVVLWVSGCEHHCKNCQNPQTWNIDSGIKFDKEAIDEILFELDKDYISGITFSGGDPLHSKNIVIIDAFIDVLKSLHHNKTIWLYTGYSWEDIFNDKNGFDDLMRRRIIGKCDVIVDGEYKEELRDVDLKWRGSSNQRVIDVKKSLEKGEIVLHCD